MVIVGALLLRLEAPQRNEDHFWDAPHHPFLQLAVRIAAANKKVEVLYAMLSGVEDRSSNAYGERGEREEGGEEVILWVF